MCGIFACYKYVLRPSAPRVPSDVASVVFGDWLTHVQAPRCAAIQAHGPENGQGVSSPWSFCCARPLTHLRQHKAQRARLEWQLDCQRYEYAANISAPGA